MSDKKNKSLKPGWRQVHFGEVVRLSKARSQDPLAECGMSVTSAWSIWSPAICGFAVGATSLTA